MANEDQEETILDDELLGSPERRRLERVCESMLARRHPANRYLVQRELARGGMGVINVVLDQDLRRTSAMKVMPPKIAMDETRLRQFVEEARVTAQLEHPNIVPIHDIGIHPETRTPFYAMKLVEGQPFNKVLDLLEHGGPEARESYGREALLDVFRSVCQAVAYAHSKGVIHRDIKPDNIMVGKFGEVQLMDWGLVKYIGSEDDGEETGSVRTVDPFSAELTQDGIIKGSPAYMAPEQACGDVEAIDERTDIFLLGAMLYHICALKPPYLGESLMDMVVKAELCDHPLPREAHPDGKVPAALEQIILKAMSPLKENRYQGVEELIREIDAFTQGRRVCVRRFFNPGEHLIRTGGHERDTFVIIEGKVEVYRTLDGRNVCIASLGPGDIVGEMAAISKDTRSANVIAKSATDALAISQESITDELAKLPPWLGQIVLSLADRVRRLDTQCNPVLLNRRFFPIIHQIYTIYLTAELPGKGQIKSSFARPDVVQEVAMQLNIDPSVIDAVFNILVECGLLRNEGPELLVRDPETFRFFVDYCRQRFEPERGVRRVKALRLTGNNESTFKRALRKLESLAEQG